MLRIIIAFLMLLFSLCSGLFWFSTVDKSPTTAELWMGIEFPTEASNVYTHKFSFLQGRTAYARFDLPAEQVPDFVTALCLEEGNFYMAPPETDGEPDGVTMPLWWTPSEATNYESDQCVTQSHISATFLIDKDDAATYTIFLKMAY